MYYYYYYYYILFVSCFSTLVYFFYTHVCPFGCENLKSLMHFLITQRDMNATLKSDLLSQDYARCFVSRDHGADSARHPVGTLPALILKRGKSARVVKRRRDEIDALLCDFLCARYVQVARVMNHD
jgi:hypothetical protein